MSRLGSIVGGNYSPPRMEMSFVSFDPVARSAVQFLKEVAGIFDLGIRFPFNNDSTTDLLVDGASYTGTGVVYGSAATYYLTDARQAWTVNQWVGATVTAGGKTNVVVSNTATGLDFGASNWTPAGIPANGTAYTIGLTVYLSGGINRYRDITINNMGVLASNVIQPAVIICAREIIINTGGAISANGVAYHSGAVGIGGAAVGAGTNGNVGGAGATGYRADRGNSDGTTPPQFHRGWATAGAGGSGGGGGGAGGTNTGGAGGSGGTGGRSCGQADGAIVTAPPVAGTVGAAGAVGGVGGTGGAGGAGGAISDIWSLDTTGVLQDASVGRFRWQGWRWRQRRRERSVKRWWRRRRWWRRWSWRGHPNHRLLALDEQRNRLLKRHSRKCWTEWFKCNRRKQRRRRRSWWRRRRSWWSRSRSDSRVPYRWHTHSNRRRRRGGWHGRQQNGNRRKWWYLVALAVLEARASR